MASGGQVFTEEQLPRGTILLIGRTLAGNEVACVLPEEWSKQPFAIQTLQDVVNLRTCREKGN